MRRKVLFLLILTVVLCSVVTVAFSQQKPLSEKQKAEIAWEALVRAKGGRARLQSVKSMLYELPSDLTRLYVLPNREWEFSSFMGKHSSIADGVRGVEIFTTTDQGTKEVENQDLSWWFPIETLPFLLETKWNKPELLRVTRVKNGKNQDDIIETMVGGRQMDFVFEIEEMLVSEVRFHDKQGVIWQVYSFADYKDVDGIKMPQTFGDKGGYTKASMDKFDIMPIKFTFNVDYDPELFTRPLIATTRDAWKRRQ